MSDLPCAVIRLVFLGGLGSRKASTFHFWGGVFFVPKKDASRIVEKYSMIRVLYIIGIPLHFFLCQIQYPF